MRRILEFARSPLLIWYVIGLHSLWGAMLIFYPNDTIPIVLLGGFQHLIDPLGPRDTGVILLGFAMLATVGLLGQPRLSFLNSFLLLLPQYIIAMFAALTSIQLIGSGFEVRSICGPIVRLPWTTLALGTGPLILSGSMHTLAILVRYADKFQGESQLDYLRQENVRLRRALENTGAR